MELYQLIMPYLIKYRKKGVSFTPNQFAEYKYPIINDISRLSIYYRDIWITTVTYDCIHFHVGPYYPSGTAKEIVWHVKLQAYEFDKHKFDELMEFAILKTDDMKAEMERRQKEHKTLWGL